MLSEKVQNWLHIAGIFGVIISLIFVGIELRQSQAIALSDAYQARAELSIALRMAPFQSTTLLSALTKRTENSSDTLTPEEIQAYDRYIVLQMLYLENVHYQYVNGFIPRDQWESNYAALKRILSDPAQRQRMLSARESASATFYEVIRRAAAEVEAAQ